MLQKEILVNSLESEQFLVYHLVESIRNLDRQIKEHTNSRIPGKLTDYAHSLSATKIKLEETLFSLRPNWR